MKLIDKDALVAEIEKRKFYFSECGYPGMGQYEQGNKQGHLDTCDDIISIINTLEVKEVQEPASEDLEQASEEYAYTNWESDDYHEGASEGKPFDAIGHTQKCFIDGAQWQKEQMMKDVIKTIIGGFRIGDKVRLKDGDGRPHIIKSFGIDGLKEYFIVVQFEDGARTMLDNISLL